MSFLKKIISMALLCTSISSFADVTLYNNSDNVISFSYFFCQYHPVTGKMCTDHQQSVNLSAHSSLRVSDPEPASDVNVNAVTVTLSDQSQYTKNFQADLFGRSYCQADSNKGLIFVTYAPSKDVSCTQGTFG